MNRLYCCRYRSLLAVYVVGFGFAPTLILSILYIHQNSLNGRKMQEYKSSRPLVSQMEGSFGRLYKLFSLSDDTNQLIDPKNRLKYTFDDEHSIGIWSLCSHC